MMEVIERDMGTETERDTDEDMETDEPMVFEVTEIDLEYEFDAARWCDFTREESPSESRVAELWFETAESYPPSPFSIKLLMMREEVSDEKTEPLSKSEDVRDRESDIDISQDQHCLATDVNETANEMKSGVFNFIQRGGELKNVPNESLLKGPTISNHVHNDKVKCRTKSSSRQIPRGSTLMKPTASQLAKLDNSRVRMQVDKTKEKGLFSSSGSEAQASKRQKLDGGLLRKVAEKTQEMNFVHKAVKKDRTLERNLQHGRTKTTVPQEPDFATSHRANRIRQKDDAKLDQDATSVYRFKARPFNRKIFEAPSLPIRKKSTPKLPEFQIFISYQEFHLKTSERAMQHSSAVSTGNNYHKGSYKPDTKAFLDGVNREPRRPRAADIAKDDDRKHIFKARPLDNKIVSSRRDIGIFRKSKRETTVSLTQTREFSFRSQKKVQQDLPTDLFSKLSIKPELQPNNGSRLRSPQPEQVKGSKENRLSSFQAGNERTRTVQGGIWTTRR
ncbi:protein TPX2 isoform X1 [Brassica rapa]|uniref:protein TPX2 isoform X1 n=1 Tax=Brassica campestris TaxID=3711 RepID=UPI00142DA8B6|nr:protein TPX2 isoform X1 [Brassica rapa]